MHVSFQQENVQAASYVGTHRDQVEKWTLWRNKFIIIINKKNLASFAILVFIEFFVHLAYNIVISVTFSFTTTEETDVNVTRWRRQKFQFS